VHWIEATFAAQSAPKAVRTDSDLMPPENAPKWQAEMAKLQPFRQAAVLVPIVLRSEPMILLTQRSAELRKHAGQISFPGGRIDPEDVDAATAALRETEEEVSICRGDVQLVGTLDQYRTGTGFEITPIVGLVAPTIEPHPEPGEVEEIFEIPLSFVMDRQQHQRHSAMWKGFERHYYAMPYAMGEKSFYIWGATAAMLVNLCDVLENAYSLHQQVVSC